ncbi:MAG: hypothetical protein FWH36_07055 [Lentimicrobiaceae bacterium]|nr:hypothetical protein [Lentimicrobiaceae bacterium]
MKKYTNKIIIIAIAVFLAVTTVLFFIQVSDVKKEEKQYEINKEKGGQL